MPKKRDPIPPGEILLEEFLKPLGLSQTQLARDIDVPMSRISGIINNERAITADTALRLGAYFDVSAEMWLNLQSQYDLQSLRGTVWNDIAPTIRKRSLSQAI